MRKTDSPYITVWFADSIRWMFLLGLVTSLSLGGQLLRPVNFLLIGLVCWNTGLTLLTGLNRRLVAHRQISLVVDLAFAAAYFVLAGGFGSPAFWIVFLPLMTSTLYFEMIGAIISSVLMIGVQVAVTFFQTRDPVALIFLGVSSLFTIAVAGLFGYLNVQLIRTNRNNRLVQHEALIGAQQKKLGMENERLCAVYSLTSTLLATLNYQRVLESVLDLSLSAINTEAEAGSDDRLICAVLLFAKNERLEVGSARRLTTTDMRVVLRGKEGAIAQTIEQDKPILLTDDKTTRN